MNRRKTPKDQCLYPDCISLEAARGLCKLHYDMSLLKVRLGKLSWKTLENRGLAKPRKNMSWKNLVDWEEFMNESEKTCEIYQFNNEDSARLLEHYALRFGSEDIQVTFEGEIWSVKIWNLYSELMRFQGFADGLKGINVLQEIDESVR
jgi:hypothetical protein